MTSPLSNDDDGSNNHPPASDHWCSRQTKAPHKWLLGMCWFLAIAHIIWFAPDGDHDGDSLDHLSFGEPEREERPILHSPGLSHYGVVGVVERKMDEGESETNSLEATRLSYLREAANRSGEVENDAGDETKKSLEAKQRSYPREAADHSGEADDDGGEESSKEATSHASEDEKHAETATAEEEETLSDDPGLVAPSNETKATETLVEALQPITSNKCCIPAITNIKGKRRGVCVGTCYNERACTDRLYPFASAAEKASLPPVEITPTGRKRLKQECTSPKNMSPAVEWCQTPHLEHEHDTAAHLVKGVPPAGCSIVTNGGGSGPFHHVLLFPSAKLAFCGIPKVGITQWEQFLRFTFGAKDYPSLPHYKLDREFFQFDRLDPIAQRRIWEDETWTWAAFVREPAERLLSAYLDKMKGKVERIEWIDRSLTFEKFVEGLSQGGNATRCQKGAEGLKGLGWCSDPHWRPQVYSCGLSERLDRFQFIGEIRNAAEHTRELLSHVGLWDSHGRRFINGGAKLGRNPWCQIGSHPHNRTRHVGFNQKDEATNSSAARLSYGHSKESVGKMEQYYTPELLRRVREELYAHDHDLWRLVSGNGAKLSRGRDLAPRLSKKCERLMTQQN